MPNWCSNEVDIFGNSEVIKEITEIIKANPEGIFQMNDFVPMPEELRDTQAPQDKPNWYDWSVINWGTKWDLGEEAVASFEQNVIGLGYNTAWAPNCAFWTAFSEKYEGVKISHRYYEEGVGFIGEAYYEDGNFEDNCQDVTNEILEKCGGVLDEDGNVDWEKSDLDLSNAFPLSGKGE
jgi:hypothetical protein